MSGHPKGALFLPSNWTRTVGGDKHMLNKQQDDGQAYYRNLTTQGLLYETVYSHQCLRRNPKDRFHRRALHWLEDQQARKCLTLDDAWREALRGT